MRLVDEGFYVTCVAEESRLDVVTIGLREKDSPPHGFSSRLCLFFRALGGKIRRGRSFVFSTGERIGGEREERGEGGRQVSIYFASCNNLSYTGKAKLTG